MKKLILFAALAVFGLTNAQESSSSDGQTAQGKWLIEANTGFAELGTTGIYFSSQDGNSFYSLGVDGGYFIMDDLAIKAGLGYRGGEDALSVFSYRIGGKYYINSMIPVGLDLTGASIEDFDENPMWLGIQAGYALFLGEHVAVEPGVRYNHSLNEDYTDKGVFQINVGFTLFF